MIVHGPYEHLLILLLAHPFPIFSQVQMLDPKKTSVGFNRGNRNGVGEVAQPFLPDTVEVPPSWDTEKSYMTLHKQILETKEAKASALFLLRADLNLLN